MNVEEWFFGFHRRATVTEIVTGQSVYTSIFGHVEAWGYTIDGTWVFFDPRARSTIMDITHIHDEVNERLSERFLRCDMILKIEHRDGSVRFPLARPHFNCVTQCSALIGLRAYTLGGFRDSLLKNGAEVTHESPERRSRGQSRTRTPESAG